MQHHSFKAISRIAIPALTAGVLAILAGSAGAQQYPNRQIRVIVPLTPGAGVDNSARLLAEGLRENLGQTVIVENRPGANGIIGTTFVAKSPPDGYTLLVVANAHVIVPLTASKLPYDVDKDFAPVATIAYTPYMLLVNPALGVNTMQQFIAYAKARPGTLNFGSAGVGAGSHMAGEVFIAMAGLRMQHIPYKGGGEALTALMSGTVHATWNTLNAGTPHVKAGRLKALAISGEARAANLPDVATFPEAGLPDYQERAWIGMFAPAATPRPIIDRLNAETAKILRSPATRDTFDKQGLLPFVSTPEQFGALLKRETANYMPIVKAANIKIDTN